MKKRLALESEDRFRKLFEQAAVGMAEIEISTGHFIMVNEFLCKIVDRTEEELLATTFQAITHPGDIHLHEEKAALLIAKKIKHYSLEKRYLRKNKGIVWVNVIVSPLWKSGEKPERNMIIVEDITERKKHENEIRHLAYYDSLTGLPNRRLFFDRLNQNIIRTKRKKGEMAVMMLDLDYLKGINDRLGHEAGDILIKETGLRIAAVLRAEDTVARLGGDEFAVIIAEIDQQQDVEIIAKKIMERVSQPLEVSQNFTTNPSIGLGIAIFPEQGLDGDTLIKNADTAMYRSKHTGEYQVFDPSNV
ncbi:MAG: diguanylate cyclase [Candidatus Moraniibacteriota bacterium]